MVVPFQCAMSGPDGMLPAGHTLCSFATLMVAGSPCELAGQGRPPG